MDSKYVSMVRSHIPVGALRLELVKEGAKITLEGYPEKYATVLKEAIRMKFKIRRSLLDSARDVAIKQLIESELYLPITATMLVKIVPPYEIVYVASDGKIHTKINHDTMMEIKEAIEYGAPILHHEGTVRLVKKALNLLRWCR